MISQIFAFAGGETDKKCLRFERLLGWCWNHAFSWCSRPLQIVSDFSRSDVDGFGACSCLDFDGPSDFFPQQLRIHSTTKHWFCASTAASWASNKSTLPGFLRSLLHFPSISCPVLRFSHGGSTSCPVNKQEMFWRVAKEHLVLILNLYLTIVILAFLFLQPLSTLRYFLSIHLFIQRFGELSSLYSLLEGGSLQPFATQ